MEGGAAGRGEESIIEKLGENSKFRCWTSAASFKFVPSIEEIKINVSF